MTTPLYRGPERRRYDRSLSASPKVVGRARFLDAFRLAHLDSLPADRWYPVMDRGHDNGLQARPGYVWLGMDGAEHQVELVRLEVEPASRRGAAR